VAPSLFGPANVELRAIASSKGNDARSEAVSKDQVF
jgi:hypothetical protein